MRVTGCRLFSQVAGENFVTYLWITRAFSLIQFIFQLEWRYPAVFIRGTLGRYVGNVHRKLKVHSVFWFAIAFLWFPASIFVKPSSPGFMVFLSCAWSKLAIPYDIVILYSQAFQRYSFKEQKMNPNLLKMTVVLNFCQINWSRKPGYKVSLCSHFLGGFHTAPSKFLCNQMWRLFKDWRHSLTFDWWFEVCLFIWSSVDVKLQYNGLKYAWDLDAWTVNNRTNCWNFFK